MIRRPTIVANQDDLEYGAFPFHSRWAILAILVAASTFLVSDYLFEVAIFTFIAFVIIRNKLALGAIIGRVPSGYDWWPIVLLTGGGILYSVGSSLAIIYPLYHLDSELVNELLAEEIIPGSAMYSFISLVVLAPILEEVLFRGLIFSRLTKKWNMTWGMILSSLAFGLLHMDPIGAFVFGIMTCVLYVRTKTLLVPMVLHAMNNLLAWFMTAGSESGEMDSTIDAELVSHLAYAGLIFMMIGAPIIFTLLGRWWPARGTSIPYEVNSGVDKAGS